MNEIRQAFATLGLPADATLKEVRHAYRSLVRSWHPDRFSDNPQLQLKAQERLKEINAAYNIARKNITITKTVEPSGPNLPDSPFRFTAPLRPLSMADTASPAFQQAAASEEKQEAAFSRRPFILNTLLVCLAAASLCISLEKFGLSLPGTLYFLQIMAIPCICAIICNSTLGSSRLRRGYLAALLLFGAVTIMDAVVLKTGTGQQSVTTLPNENDTPWIGRSFGGNSVQSPAGYPPEEMHRQLDTGPQSPLSPTAPIAPVAPSPALPAAPVAPRGK